MKSWMDRFQGTIRDKIDWLRYHRFEDFEVTREKCQELIEYAETIEDHALLGFSYFYISQTYFFALQFDLALQVSKVALQHLEKSDAPILLSYCYDQIGCIYFNHNVFESAADYFLKAITIAEKIDNHFGIANTLSNLANLYFMLQDYQKSYELFNRASEEFLKCNTEPAIQMRLFYNKAGNIACRIQLHEYDGVLEEIEMMNQNRFEFPIENKFDIYYYSLLFDYYWITGNKEKADEIFNPFIKSITNVDDVPAAFISSIIKTCIEIYKSQNQKWINQLDAIFDELILLEMTSIQKVKLIMARYQTIQDKQSIEAVELIEKLLEYNQDHFELEIQSKLQVINELYEMNEETKKVQQLEELAYRDSLTGLYNRRSFEKEFSKVSETQNAIAVGVIDVNQFKKYNEYYGRAKGDEVLIKLGQLMEDHTNRNITFFRYDGDEFLFIARDLHAIQLVKHIQLFITDLECLKIEHQYSQVSPFVTVSIGISFHSNASSVDMKTILEEVDQELYAVKKERSGFYKIKISK